MRRNGYVNLGARRISEGDAGERGPADRHATDHLKLTAANRVTRKVMCPPSGWRGSQVIEIANRRPDRWGDPLGVATRFRVVEDESPGAERLRMALESGGRVGASVGRIGVGARKPASACRP